LKERTTPQFHWLPKPHLHLWLRLLLFYKDSSQDRRYYGIQLTNLHHQQRLDHHWG
jgi:hypothetical protein